MSCDVGYESSFPYVVLPDFRSKQTDRSFGRFKPFLWLSAPEYGQMGPKSVHLGAFWTKIEGI